MLALLASLVFVGAGLAAVLAIVLTVREQGGAVRRLLADARSLQRDRDYLVRITGATLPASPRMALRRPRMPQWAVRRQEVRAASPVQARAA